MQKKHVREANTIRAHLCRLAGQKAKCEDYYTVPRYWSFMRSRGTKADSEKKPVNKNNERKKLRMTQKARKTPREK